MLTTNSSTTPRRPLPPAKARKSTSLHFAYAPPPPYSPSGAQDEVLLGSPIPVTAQILNAASSNPEGIELPGTPGVEDWMNEKSREELSELLLKADGIIKSRESELSLTSVLCKTLYTDNVTLKTKHEALLARIPATRTSTPTTSRPSSPFRLDSPTIERSPSYSVAFPASPTEPTKSLSAFDRIRRTRRISVTPSELALLSDQNAELLDKLEKLESESGKADQAGKRKLRKLEQEIQTLRDELENTQARGVELEAQAKAATSAVAAQKRKEEREARLQELKDKSNASPDAMSSEEVRDFAPPNFLSRTRASPLQSSSSTTTTGTDEQATDLLDERIVRNLIQAEDDHMEEGHGTYFPQQGDAPPSHEYAIVLQLLAKIRELEATNAQIKDQQKATEDRMRIAQWDAESIRRVYDFLEHDDVDLEIQEEDSEEPRGFGTHLSPPSDGTMRFSSLRRSIVGDVSRLMASESDVFAEGISKEMHSTMREDIVKLSSGSKTRKTVVGLFDAGPSTRTSEGWGEYPPSLKVSPAFLSRDDADTSMWSSSATEGLALLSPTVSTLQTGGDGAGMGRTLGSELGSECGDDWAERGINFHLRASSLADLAGLYSSPASPNNSISILPPITFPTSGEHEHKESDVPRDGRNPSTPPRVPEFKFEPPTPSSDRTRSQASQRQYRLSQTVRARTNRWVEGRFQTSHPHQESLGENSLRPRPSASTLGRASARTLFSKAAPGILGQTFDSAVGQIKRVASRSSFSPLAFASVPSSSHEGRTEESPDDQVEGHADEEEGQNTEADRSMTLRPDGSVADPLEAKRDGIVGFVLEAWLWLQFIIVVALFLWAMAKRGPQVVLEAERRNAQRATKP